VSLKELYLAGCQQLRSLPDGICNLVNLKALNVSRTAIQALPVGIAGCTALKTLDLGYCSSLASLPEGIQALERQGCTIIR